MTDAYSVQSRPVTREPYRGARRTNRRTGETQVWNGSMYVPEASASLLTGTEQQQLTDARNQANSSASILPDLSRFDELNRTTPTGAISHRIGGMFGLPRLLNIDNNASPEINTATNIDEMRSITDRLAPRMRAPGSGASSDRDVAMFVSGLPNTQRGGNANHNIIEGLRRNVRRDQDYASYLEWYAEQNRTLTGAQEGWSRYMQTPSNRRPEWRQFFSAGPASAPGAPMRPRGVPPEAQWNAETRTWRMP